MDAGKLLSQLKHMDKSKRDQMLDSLDNALSDEQKQKLIGMIKSKQLDSLLADLIQSQEVQQKLSDLLQ